MDAGTGRKRAIANQHYSGYSVAMSVILETLREAVADSGESLNAISRGSGIAVSNLSRFMSRETGLSVEVCERLAEYLGVTITVKRPKRRKRG